jgi:hypothetical protein
MTQIEITDEELLIEAFENCGAETMPGTVECGLWLLAELENPDEMLVTPDQTPIDEFESAPPEI